MPVPSVGDLVIRKDFERFVTALSGDCISITSNIPADDAAVVRLAGQGGLAPREAFRSRSDIRSAMAPWLLGIAIAAAIAELFVRRRRVASQQAASESSGGARRAA